ncbi:MAG TPA: YceI family protein [Terriglobales bacterium]|nr:YceI family protein [Terriglobales bacterium]
MRRLLPLLAVLSLVAAAAAQTATWTIDPAHSTAAFTVRHMMINNVRGEFSKTTGTLQLDPKDITKSTVEASIDAATVNTRVEARDADLRSANFFDVAKYPILSFKSTKVEQVAPGKLRVTGDLTMHGVTRPVVLDVDGPSPAIKDPWGNTRIGLSASTKINRKDWGLMYNKLLESGGMVVSEEVAIDLELEFVQKAPAPSKGN